MLRSTLLPFCRRPPSINNGVPGEESCELCVTRCGDSLCRGGPPWTRTRRSETTSFTDWPATCYGIPTHIWQPVLVSIQRQRCQRPLYSHYTNRLGVTPFWFRSNVLTELLADDIGLTTNLASGIINQDSLDL